MSIVFIKPGLLTTIQDTGRFGLLQYGICRSGAMDLHAMEIANWLVRNPSGYPVVEVTMTGPTLEFTKSLSVAITGANFDVFKNDKKVDCYRTIQVKKGDQIAFGKLRNGARAYIAFSGEIDLKKHFESYSTHLLAGFGGLNGKAFKVNDELPLFECHQVKTRVLPQKYRLNYIGNYRLRCTESVESLHFSRVEQRCFFEQSYIVLPNSNRMGIRLDGKPIMDARPMNANFSQLISSGLVQGSIQIPPSGLPIISSVDGQTIGGYPRIANVISADLHLLGQLRANDRINFSLIYEEEAIKILKRKRELIESLLTAK